eukprot:s6607_g3.t8
MELRQPRRPRACAQELMSPNFLSPLRGDGGSLHSERWAEIVKNLTKRGALYRNYTDDEGEARREAGRGGLRTWQLADFESS